MSLTLAFNTEFKNNFVVFGEKILGTVVLENKETLKNCEYLKVVLCGFENVHWTETHTTHSGTGSNRRSHTHTTHYRNHRVLFEVPLFLWKSHYKNEDLQPGKHAYDFIIQMPLIPMSSSIKAQRGQIEYHLYSFLSQGNDGILDSVLSFFGVFKGIKVVQALNVVGSQATQQILDTEGYYKKKIGSREKTFMFKWGKMCMNVALLKSLYLDGEDALIELVVQNGTSESAKEILFEIQETLQFRATNKVSSAFNTVVALKYPMAVLANKRSQGAFKVTIPKGMPESTLDPHCIVSRNYDLVVKIPCGITYPEVRFQIIIVNQVGCPLRSQLYLKKVEEEIIQEDEFEVVEKNLGILDDFPIDEKKKNVKVQPTAPKLEEKKEE